MPGENGGEERGVGAPRQRPAYVRAQRRWTDDHTVQWAKNYRTEIAASSSSLLSTLLTFPLDSIKTRMQTYPYASVRDCVRSTYKLEGMSGFWRGVLAPLMSITVVRTVSFTVYQKAKYTIDGWYRNAFGVSPLHIANTKGANPNIVTMSCFGLAGATAGGLATFIACPFELMKLSRQTSYLPEDQMKTNKVDRKIQRSYQNLGTLRTAQALVKNRGFRGLYSGLHLHMLRDIIGTGIYFASYETAKQYLANGRQKDPTSGVPVAIAGGICGLVSWICIYPIDTAKSVYQKSCLSTHKDRTEKSSLKYKDPAMYRGLIVSMTRSSFVNMIFFSTFEAVKKRINALEYDEPHLFEQAK